MTAHLADRARDAAPARLATVWVLARQLMVSESVAGALTHQGDRARALDWAEVARHVVEMDPVADVVVLIDDLTTPGSMDDLADLVRLLPPRVVVLTAHPATHVWGGLFESGVHEVVSSAGSVSHLADVILTMAAGGVVTAEADRAVLRECWRRSITEEQALISRLARLSPGERRVLDLLAAGIAVAGIQQELGVSESTVRSQVKSLRRKVGVDSQIAAVAVLRRIRLSMRRRVPTPICVPGPRRPSE